MLGLVVFGSRTWIWTIAAPALAASRQEFAICSGVTGTAGLRPGVSAEPVTAQEIITFLAIYHSLDRCPPSTLRPGSCCSSALAGRIINTVSVLSACVKDRP